MQRICGLLAVQLTLAVLLTVFSPHPGKASELISGSSSGSTGIEAMHFDPEDPGLFIADADGSIRRWDFITGEIEILRRQSQMAADRADSNVIRIDPYGASILHADGSGPVRRIAARSTSLKEQFSILPGQTEWRSSFEVASSPVLAISQSGDLGAVGDAMGKIILFKMEDGSILWEKELPDPIRFLAFSASDETLYTFGKPFALSTGTGEAETFEIDTGPGLFTSIDIAPAGLIALGSVNSILLIEGATGQQMHKIETGSLHSVLALSSDGRKLATNSDAGVLIFDTQSGTAIGEVRNSDQPIHALAFSNEAHVIATGDASGLITLWRSSDFSPILHARIWPEGYVVFLEDGSLIGQRGDDAFWDRVPELDQAMLSPGKIREALFAVSGRPEEFWRPYWLRSFDTVRISDEWNLHVLEDGTCTIMSGDRGKWVRFELDFDDEFRVGIGGTYLLPLYESFSDEDESMYFEVDNYEEFKVFVSRWELGDYEFDFDPESMEAFQSALNLKIRVEKPDFLVSIPLKGSRKALDELKRCAEK